jgi:hypothetical protein|tara:strand:+ start:3576 stop:3695 length:120 start_codon:yes stop_codon:yes gene_type:complete
VGFAGEKLMLKFKKEWHRDLFFAMTVLTLIHLVFVVGGI